MIEFEIKYVKKENMHKRKTMQGNVHAWVFAENRKEALQKFITEDTENEFGKLLTVKRIKT